MAETRGVDVLVVGGGPAGIAAATTAAELGKRVLLVDEGRSLGGQIWRGRALPPNAESWLSRLRGSGADVASGFAVVDGTAETGLLLEGEDRTLRVGASSVVLATGARERFLPFPGWTLPGVMGVGGIQALLKSGASFRGLRVVVAGTGPLLFPVAASLAKGGARVALVAEQAPAARVRRFALGLRRWPRKIAEALAYRAAFWRTPLQLGTWVKAAHGGGGVESVTLTDGRREWTQGVDALACAYGLVPNTELARLLGCVLDNGNVVVDGELRTSVPGVWAAGEPVGIGGVDRALLQGEIAGASVAGQTLGGSRALRHRRLTAFSRSLDQAFAPRHELRRLAAPETIVCRCEDVTHARIDPLWTRRQCKLYTRAGMGACQGRVCGPALEFLFGYDPDRERPPVKPSRISTLEAH